MDSFNLNIILVNGNNLVIKCTSITKAEDLCTTLCRQLKIAPLTRTLFSLRLKDAHLYLADNSHVDKNATYELRIRYKVPHLLYLKNVDINTYNYYFHQVRSDVLESAVPEIVYSKHKKEVLGLGTTDMYRIMQEERKSIEEVVRDYKKYIPKEIIKKHSIFIKKPINNTLARLQKTNHDVEFVKGQYFQKFESMAPNYLAEQYNALYEEAGSIYEVDVYVMPFDSQEPGLRMHLQYKKEWTHICTVEEICFLAMRDDGTVEISRKNGIPVYLKFFTVTHMLSFLSVCDGYYRLMVKWTFNLCKGVPSPSLEHLYQMKCHGPVGGEFSYNKLQEKRSCAPGCYILRQCQHEYDVYYLDVCSVHSNTPETYKIEFIESNYYLYDNEKVTKHGSLEELISLFKDPTARIYLKECLPASEYDKSPLLLCGSRRQPKAGDRIDQVTLDEILKQSRNPRCIDTKDVLLFKGSKFEGTEGLTITYKAMWNVSQDKKIDVAFKMLKSDQHLKEFIDLTGRWAFAKSDAIVRLYGVTLRSPSAMVMEYMKLGPLDEYLRKQKNLIQPVDLVEAAASVATALWNLSESDMVHGYLRCRKILVAAHDSSKFVVKLAEPGLHCYNETDCHWLPIECFSNPESAQTSTYADVWALGTTLWEIFSYGLSPAETNPVLTKMSYTRGHRLSMPDGCPAEVYSVMMSCWLADPHRRSIPQVIMRDLCHLLYQVYNSRRVHSYSTVILKTNIDQSGASTITSDKLESYSSNKSSLLSVMTDLLGTTNSELDADSIYGDFEPSTHDIDFMRSHTGMDNSFRSVTNMHCIFELDHDATVTRQGLLGQGFYGEVYRGILERTGCQPQDVAIKKLKTNANNAELNDFIREINIMKSLRHPNIVSILGIIEEPEMQLVMEYVEHGSLQSYVKIYRQRLTTQYFLKFAHSIAEGMSYLGVMNVVHRDLAARNILVANEGHVKITDFGLAQETKHDDYYLLQTNRNLPLDWYAPESVRHHKFSTRSDVWSYGVTMWEMFSYGDLPPSWAGYPSINVETREQSFRCPAACPELVFEELVRPCWNMTPSERPKFFDIVTICIQLMHKH